MNTTDRLEKLKLKCREFKREGYQMSPVFVEKEISAILKIIYEKRKTARKKPKGTV